MTQPTFSLPFCPCRAPRRSAGLNLGIRAAACKRSSAERFRLELPSSLARAVGLALAQAQGPYLTEPFYWDQSHGTRPSGRALLEEQQRTHRKFASMMERELAAVRQAPRLGDDWTVTALSPRFFAAPGVNRKGGACAMMWRAIVREIARGHCVSKVAMSNLSGPQFRGDQLAGWLHLENLIALRKRHPGLLAAGPDMPCRPQPRSIVERARTHSDYTIPRPAANPGAALRTH